MGRPRDILEYLKSKSKRMNQLLLCLPVWLVLGLSGFFLSSKEQKGWIETDEERRPQKMY